MGVAVLSVKCDSDTWFTLSEPGPGPKKTKTGPDPKEIVKSRTRRGPDQDHPNSENFGPDQDQQKF